jgi:predicted Zn-dependent protease
MAGWGISGKTGIALMVISVLILLSAPGARAQRTRVKPGLNLFSVQQDVEVGREVSKEAEQQIVMLNDRRVNDYLTRLGLRLASKAPGEKYPYQFKAVNDTSINAFALPGGFLYVNRGTIEVADNEAQLAGVMGHEIAHAALRHGTNQASKATLVQGALGVAGGAVGGNSIAGLVTQIGGSFGANSLLLKYSRDAERQADLVGTQILYDNNYDPRAMAQFFEKLLSESKGRTLQFFSSHPNPENRITAVNAEIKKMGGDLKSYQNDSAEFREVQKYVKSLPQPPKAATGQAAQGSSGSSGSSGKSKPALPSTRMQNYQNNNLTMQHPDNWRASGNDDAFSLAPDGGIVTDGQGNSGLAYGVAMATFNPQADSSTQTDLEGATDQLIASLQKSNPQMRVVQQRSRIRVNNLSALSTKLSNPSPVGGNETDWLVTFLRPEGLAYFVFVAPEGEYANYQRVFQDMINSIKFSRR